VDIPSQTDTERPTSPIPRRKKSSQQPNGHSQNGTTSTANGTNGAKSDVIEATNKKRSAAEALEDGSQAMKRSKMKTNGADDGVISIDDSADGAILIDDD
jgi:ubiquitin-like 1-activating enzyme E1 B